MTDGLVRPRAGDDRTLWRIVASTSVASGVVGAVGVVFLVGMFSAFAVDATATAQTLGHINDWAVLVSYLLCAPSVAAVWRLLRPSAPVVGALLLGLGIASIAGIVVLQWLLVTDALTFEEQIGIVWIAFVALDVWFVITGYLGSRAGLLPRGTRLGIVAATYVGYPIWAIWFAARLRALMAPTGGVEG